MKRVKGGEAEYIVELVDLTSSYIDICLSLVVSLWFQWRPGKGRGGGGCDIFAWGSCPGRGRGGGRRGYFGYLTGSRGRTPFYPVVL